MTLNSFDKIAPAYDRLAKLVFGKEIKDAQKYFLNDIPVGGKVLILGGGTGWILEELFKEGKNYEVWYIDASKEMIFRAKEKSKSYQKIVFIHGTEEDVPVNSKKFFDVAITNFYVDLFDDLSLNKVIQKIKGSLKEDSRWIVTDFINTGKWWHRFMLGIMYVFFRLTCRIAARRLPNWQKALITNGFKIVKSKNFYHNFIKSEVYIIIP